MAASPAEKPDALESADHGLKHLSLNKCTGVIHILTGCLRMFT